MNESLASSSNSQTIGQVICGFRYTSSSVVLLSDGARILVGLSHLKGLLLELVRPSYIQTVSANIIQSIIP
jgi:hypothetical protein